MEKRIADYRPTRLAPACGGDGEEMGVPGIGDEVAGRMMYAIGKADGANGSRAASKNVFRQMISPVLEHQPCSTREAKKARQKENPIKCGIKPDAVHGTPKQPALSSSEIHILSSNDKDLDGAASGRVLTYMKCQLHVYASFREVAFLLQALKPLLKELLHKLRNILPAAENIEHMARLHVSALL